MRDSRTFEQRLAAALDAYAGPPRAVDAATIAHRAAGASARSDWGWRRPHRDRLWLLAAALVTATLIAGVLLVAGQKPDRREQVLPSPIVAPFTSLDPTPTANPAVMSATFSCAEAQRWTSRTATTWKSTAPPPATEARSGWIAVWGTQDVPEVILVDPTTGDTCPIVRFEGRHSATPSANPEDPRSGIPVRGPLVWSPDGRALAIIVKQDTTVNDVVHRVGELFVWSELGLTQPVGPQREPSEFGTPAWSPDGSTLAVPLRSSIWFLSNVNSHELGCECVLLSVAWSPSGSRIAVSTQTRVFSEGLAVASVEADALTSVELGPGERGKPDHPSAPPYGWLDEQTLLVLDMDRGRITARAADGLTPDQDLGPIGSSIEEMQFPSPDRTGWLFEDNGLYINNLEGNDKRLIVPRKPFDTPLGWAPNSQAVGYLVDEVNSLQGIWVVNRDGSGWRRVNPGSFALESYGYAPFAWQPVWLRP
jgi:hypothetical protein